MPAPSPIHAYDLRVDDRTDNVAVANVRPTLSWRMRSAVRDVEPCIVRLQAASSVERLESGNPDLWSLEVNELDLPRIVWDGAALSSRSRVHWRVAVAEHRDQEPVWSEPASFAVALLDDSDWAARWITHPAWVSPVDGVALPVLGIDVTLPADVVRARLYSAGAGVFSVSINGREATADVLSPGYSTWSERVGATAWDVSPLLVRGENSIRVALGTGIAWVPPIEGRYSKLSTLALAPRYLGQLEVEFADGSHSVIATDDTWSATTGSVVASHWYGGEDQDARLPDGSSAIDGTWVTVAVLGDAGLHARWWSEHPPLRVTETVAPVSITRLDDGTRLVDFGVNIAGWPVMELPNCDDGVEVTLWPGEMLGDDGRVDQHSIGIPTWDSVITAAGMSAWHPRFVYHGFRYLEVRGLGDEDANFEARVIRASNASAGSFSSSDDFLNTLHRIIDRAVQGNMYSVFTDCPNREKLGWVEQLYLCFEAVTRNYDANAHLRDALQHMRDAQLDNGSITSIAPETVSFAGHEWGDDPNAFRDDVNWGGVIAFLPWRLYENYGDRRALEESWDAIERYADYLDSRSTGGLLDFGLGDWIALDTSTPRALVATFGYIRYLEAAIRIAGELGRADAAALLSDRLAQSRAAFASAFGSDDGTTWGSGSQGSFALALDLEVVPPTAIDAAFDNLLGAIESNGWCVSVGENSWPSMMAVLHERGRDDIINRLVRTVDGPGYGWQVMYGATALAESWQGAAGAKFENSQNHFMLGMVHDWLHGDIAGLRQATDSIAWRTVHVRPTLVDGVDAASTEYSTPFGLASVAWSRDASGFDLSVLVPPGSRAVIDVPDSSSTATSREGLRGSSHEPGFTRFTVSSGEWKFSS
jgi:alpha-L-rhamnosidase